MAQISSIFPMSNPHGETARASVFVVEVAMTIQASKAAVRARIKTITPKSITKR